MCAGAAHCVLCGDVVRSVAGTVLGDIKAEKRDDDVQQLDSEDDLAQLDDDFDDIVLDQHLWRRSHEAVATTRLKGDLESLEMRFGTDQYVNNEVLTHSAPDYVILDKGTTDRLPVNLMYGGKGTIKVGVHHSSGGTSWRVKISWKDLHSIDFTTPTSVTIETTMPFEILAQPQSKGVYKKNIDDTGVGGNLQHTAHLTITFQNPEDSQRFKSGLETMGTPGMLASAQV